MDLRETNHIPTDELRILRLDKKGQKLNILETLEINKPKENLTYLYDT